MKIKKHIILVSVLFVINFYFLIAQQLQTEIINTTNGLSNNKVFHVFQDSYGLLWIGTEYGLNLYDGYKFKVYRNNPDDPESINSNVIWWIVEDKEKNLWIATGEGVSKYIRAESKFKNYDLFGDYFSSVTIFIDSKENIWAAHETENINKYNEQNDSWEKQNLIFDSTKTYRSPAQIMRIIEDNHKKLWIASIRYGLMWYDEQKEVFRQAEIKFDDGIMDFTNQGNMLTDLFPDSAGVIWITSRNGIHKYNPTTKELKSIKKYISITGNDYNSISQDPGGNIWISNNYNGFLKFDGISDECERIKIAGQNYSIKGKSDISLIESFWDKSGVLWLGTHAKGLIKFDPNKKYFKHYIHDESIINSLSRTEIFSLLESNVQPNTIYVGTRGGGLNILNTKTNTFSQIPITFYKDIYGGSIRSIYEESDGSLWLGTWGDGLLKMDSQCNIVNRFAHYSTDMNSISNDRVRVIKKDQSGNLWIGTNIGLNYFDVESNTFTRLSKDLKSYSQKIIDLIKNKISDSLDAAKIIEVGDFQKLSYDFKVSTKNNYLVVSAGEGTGFDSSMWDYGWIEDQNNEIIWSSKNYLSTFHIGGALKNRIKIELIQLEPGDYSLNYESDDSHSFGKWNESPPVEPELWGIRIFKISDINEINNLNKLLFKNNQEIALNGISIRDIQISNNNIVWIGTDLYGLQKIDLTKKDVKTYLFNNTINNASRFKIYDIYENNVGILWLATNRGLIEFNPVSETFQYFSDKEGLPINSIHSIVPGKDNELWLGTLNGLSNMKIDFSGNPTFVNYGLEDGLGGMDFTQLVALKSKNGKYYFGGNHGLNEFDENKSISSPPNLYLSDFKISNVSFARMYEDSLIETSLMDLVNLSLNHNQNDLSFEFAALHFSNPKKNKYAHKLEGYENDWIYDNSRIATYTNLDPGEYTFKFKGSNSEGVWNEESASLNITITPPWWQAWWAYTIYFFVTLIAIYEIRKYELKRIQLKNQLMLEQVNSENLKELDHVKSNFFANISHEFRTPLTLILGQINKLYSYTLDRKIKSELEVANRNARRLLQLINQLLDLSKIESGNMNIKSVRGDIISFLKNIFYSFESLANEKKITINCVCNYPKIELNYDPVKLEKVFFNLLSNAFKFTPDGGKIEITVKLLSSSIMSSKADMNGESGFVEITVTDTGIGIPAENLQHLFDRFYQVDNSTTREHQGTGIGLALSKELVELHKGKISVKSTIGEGTTFIVRLPCNNGKLIQNDSQKFEPNSSLPTKNNLVAMNDLSIELEKDIPLLSTNDIKSNGKEIILVVEDNSDVRNYIVEQLINCFHVLTAKDGQEGLSLAKERIPDLIITDVMMPKIDGYQLTTESKQDEKTSHIPIVMLTAKASIDNKIEGLEIGADDYLIKPFNSEELLVRVKNLIATRRQLRKQFSKATIIKPSDVTSVSMDQQFLQKVINIVDNHLEDEEFGVGKLAEETHMSVSQLNRKLNALIDQPAGKLIRSMRLQRAADLLRKKSATIAEISYQLGFSSQANFTRAFKQQFGDSPVKYKIRFTHKD